MNLSLSHVRTIIGEVPMHAKLAYCLLRDERVPMAPKAAVLFVDACPEEVVADNRAAINERSSAWDRDRAAGVEMAREGLGRLVQNWRSRLPKAS